ncbi:MAG TPA: DUF6797 domain-containing protein, partial [Pirellulales bacterium]|nr:DUF6797 domain-containing protein [Pirellulales bacterium]
VESILSPSKTIKKGFETVTLVTGDGATLTGLLVEDRPDSVVIRDAARDGKLTTLAKRDIDERTNAAVSLMPAGLVNQLADRGQFLDLVRYLMEVATGGPAREAELRPAAALLAPPPLPEYEDRVDHAGLIRELDRASFSRGEAIYSRLCANCHGTHDQPGSLPTSLRFASGTFKNGSDPYAIYQTLTKGLGQMSRQSWMVPRQKYDVIHYLREAYLKKHNPTQYTPIDGSYLAKLPRGETHGPEPRVFEPWTQMDYGPSLINTYEIGDDGSNFAYKGIAVRLDAGPGGVSQGRHWMVFDHDTLRVAAAWSGEGFIDFQGIQFNGQHEVHPRIVGQVQFGNPIGPGWSNPADGRFDDPRLRGRDGRCYGPLPRTWGRYRGLYHFGGQTIISSTIGDVAVLESPGLAGGQAGLPVFTRTMNLGPRSSELVLQVAHVPAARLETIESAAAARGSAVVLGATNFAEHPAELAFDGATCIEVAGRNDFAVAAGDFTIAAQIRTRKGGTIFAKSAPRGDWVPDAQAFFVRGGKLVFDIGWVGAVTSRALVDDDRWHAVAIVHEQRTGKARLFIDGRQDAQGQLRPRGGAKGEGPEGHVVRLGYAAPNFPEGQSYFHGRLSEVHFYRRALAAADIAALAKDSGPTEGLVAHWPLDALHGAMVHDATGQKHDGTVAKSASKPRAVVAGLTPLVPGAKWLATDTGNLRLRLPAGDEPLRFTVWVAGIEPTVNAAELASAVVIDDPQKDLLPCTHGGPPRWPATLATQGLLGADDGPFAVDVLTHPVDNPWFCQMRFTGLDFLADGRQAAVCSWDGDVWLVTGIDRPEQGLAWQRIASGLFQPLGLKVVEGRIFVTCRDQIVVLNDINGDGETDYYENFNNDHQVTEHFHEFAMGLQSDEAGNLYYAKSARHGKQALVPHHGTLLRVSRDGDRTDIVATGFRAANGVCVNADGSFFVTDQEGHWNPKNRINRVVEGDFYGNMWGYHDVADESDRAMQPPLCWITNAFDRSPAELVWVPAGAWGPLAGSLLNLSYGCGKIFVVPHEQVGPYERVGPHEQVGQYVQGGMCALPMPRFPTGVMRGRFHPTDRQLYACGMFAWAGDQQQPGGLYRVRYTGRPICVPIGLHARREGMELVFSGPLDRRAAAEAGNYRVKTWSLKRTANYGSEHYGEKPLTVTSVTVSPDGRKVFIKLDGIAATWCMEIAYALKSAEGAAVEGVIHNTIHELGE